MNSGLVKVAVAWFLLTIALVPPAMADVSPAEIKDMRLKAASGDLEAVHALGYALQQDEDSSNDIEGRDLLIQAAEGGRWGSAFYLGQAYLYGWTTWGRIDGEGNGGEGVRWLRRAAEIAERNREQYAFELYGLLGEIYSAQYGRGLPANLPAPDVAEATKWFRLCAVSEDAYGGRYCRGQLGILLTETPGGEDEGLQWLEKAAALGEPWSMNRLGDVYADGKIVQRDDVLALAWYERSAKWTKRVGVYNDLAHESERKAEALKVQMSAEEIARGAELARQFELKATP